MGSGSLLNGDATARAARALLRTTGGQIVFLRVAAASSAAAAQSGELGLATPLFQDVAVGPAVFRQIETPRVLLIAAGALAGALKAVGAASVEVLLRMAVGVVVNGDLYRIEKNQAMTAVGEVYCYALTLIAPAQ